MQEAEISPCGEIVVNKQKIGQMEGFRLAAGNDAAALLQGADAEFAPLLQQAYDKQVERFIAAPQSSLALGHDGCVRWQGQVIAKLAAGEDILRPRCIFLGDEPISAIARDYAVDKIQRFVSTHFEALLKPLFDLAAADFLEEKPRFVAMRLVEHLGIVPRRHIAAAVKELGQESRAQLRRLGVRFGVYNIFIPSLLKPAAAQALTFLWALHNDGLQKAGYGDIIACLAAGRTSFAVEEGISAVFYRLGGYRLLGKRAVRIDMLERCADLIRLALAWNPHKAAAIPRADGAYDGKYFTVTPAMLSVLGAKAEDMKDILQHLRYASRPISKAEYQAFLQKDQSAESGSVVPAAELVGDFALSAELSAVEEREKSAIISAEFSEKAEQNDGNASAAAVLSVPDAEPVGSKFTGGKKRAAAESADVVLLWYYQKNDFKKTQKKPIQRKGGVSAAASRSAETAEEADANKNKSRFFSKKNGKQREGAALNGENGKIWQSKQTGAKQKRGANISAGGDIGNSGGGRSDERGRRGYGQKREKNGQKKDGSDRRRDFARPHYLGEKKQNRPVNIEDSPFAALAALRDKLQK